MNKTKLRAYSVHIYTTIGIVCGFFALAAVYEENLKDAFFYLGLALFIDGTDGFLARRFEVNKYAPRIDGVILDAIVDYFNYVILPVIIIIKFQFLPSAISYPICILILVASCYTFANVKQKTKDNYFNGFPALWNLLILYFYILQTEQIVNLFVVIVSLICTFLPIKYVHPLRVKNYRFLAILLFSVWGITSVILIYMNSKEFLYQSFFWIWVIANALIFLVSLKRTFKF